ncbi:MAG: MASE3 domain-containing protein, partial [Thermodesulfobacteriota bacterium]
MAAGRDLSHSILSAGLAAAVVLGLYASSLQSYILFHSLVELITIAVGLTLFILTWNTSRFLTNGCLKALGIGYGLIAGVDLFHTLAYKGMGVFPEYGANLPTQLWIAARSLQAVLLLAASLLAGRDINERAFLGIGLAAVSATGALVYSGAFPDCFIEGRGLTRFKIASEYVICAILAGALLLLARRRTAFRSRVFRLITLSILCTIGSELAFTSYVSVYGPANMVGHFLKLAAFYLVYRALVVTGLKEPFDLIFRDLKLAEAALTRERIFSHGLLEGMADGVVACDADGHLALFNRTAREWHGVEPLRLPATEWTRQYNLFRADGITPLPTEEIPLARAFRGEMVRDAGMAIVAAGQPPRHILANGSVITDPAGRKLGAVVVMRDVTAFRRLEQDLRQANETLEARVAERTEALRRLNRELRALKTCSQTLMKAGDEETLLADICRIVCEEAGYRLAWVGYAERDRKKSIRPVAWAGDDADYVERALLSWSEEEERGQGPAGIAVRSGEPVHVEDFVSDPRMAPWRESALAHGFRSGIALPLKDETAAVFGVLLIYSTEPYAVTAQELCLLEELAADLAFGITVLRNRAGIRRAEKVTQARLRMLEAAYTGDFSLGDTLRRMLDEIEAQTGSCISFYHFMDEDQQTLSFQSWSSKTLATGCTAEGAGRHVPLAEAGVWAECVRQRRPVIHDDYPSLPERKGLPAGHAPLIRELLIPIFRSSRIMAVIGVGNKPDPYSETDVQVTSLLADFSWEIVTRQQAVASLRRSEESLRQRERLLRESQRVGQVGSWDWDARDDVIWWSDEYCRIHGFAAGTRPPSYAEHRRAYTPESTARLDAAVQRAMTLGEPCELDLELASPTATTRWIAARCEVKRDAQGAIRGLRGTAQNITERKRAEEEIRLLNQGLERRVQERTTELEAKTAQLLDSRQALMSLVEDLNEKTAELEEARLAAENASRAKSAFLANMSHELRTPLNAVMGFAQILSQSGDLAPEHRKILGIIVRSGEHLLSLINDVLELAKIEAGGTRLAIAPFDLTQLLEDVGSLFAVRAEANELSFRIVIDPTLPRCADGDAGRIRQVLINLLGNAIKFTRAGGIRLVAGPGAGPAGGEPAGTMLRCAVEDTGPGIAPDQLAAIFEPFVQVGDAADQTAGTGLGLSLSRHFVELMGGSIGVRSTPGVGSTFFFEIPLAAATGEVGAGEPARAPAPTARDPAAADRTGIEC